MDTVNWPASASLPPVGLRRCRHLIARWGTEYATVYQGTPNGTEVFLGRRVDDRVWEIRLRRKNYAYLGDGLTLQACLEQLVELSAEYALPPLSLALTVRS